MSGLQWGQKLIESNPWYLAPLSWIWGLAAFCKNKFYDWKLLPVSSVPVTVVSIGNIVAGGTGKTPLVHLLAKTFAKRRVAILSRGYGKVPDEPMLLQRRLPEVKVYIGKNRIASAQRAVAEGAELILLDDGFQHRKLKRDFDLVILDGRDPFGRGHYLPWGFLRDSPTRLKEADALFIQGNSSFFPHAIQVKSRPKRILDLQERVIPSIQGWVIGMFCGIAKPQKFKKTLIDLGATICKEWILGDHEPADPVPLQAFAAICKTLGAKALICTEKDFVKLSSSLSLDLPLLFIEIEMEIIGGKEKWQELIESIDSRMRKF